MRLEQRLYRHYKRETARPRRRSFILADMLGYAAAAAVIAAAFVVPSNISQLARGYTRLLEQPEVRSAVESGFSHYKQALEQKK
mgnify:FL=1